MNTTLIKPVSEITGRNPSKKASSLCAKTKMVMKHLNSSKYEVLGFVDRTNDVVLRPRYYNVRNKLGQFACIE